MSAFQLRQSWWRLIKRTCLYKPEGTVLSFLCCFWELETSESELKAALLRRRHKSNIWSKANEGWMSPSEQTAQNGDHRGVLAPWQDKNTHKWDDWGICGASNYLLDRAKAAFMKRQSTVWFVWGLCGEVWCLQRLFCFSFADQQQTCPYCSPSFGIWNSRGRADAQAGGCAGAKSLWCWGDLQSLWSAKPFLPVLTAAATRQPQTDGSPPA